MNMLNNCQLKIRVPRDVKAFIEGEARENSSSQNSEIVRCIRAAMKSKSEKGGRPFLAQQNSK